MVASHRSIIAGAVLLVASATGAGADYYGGMKDAPVTVLPPSWYVRGDVGYGWLDAGELSGAITPFGSLSIDNTWSVGGGVGRYFGRGFRGDITYEYRGKTDVHGDGVCGGGSAITGDFNMRSSLLMANVYYDFRPYERLTPYVGLSMPGSPLLIVTGNWRQRRRRIRSFTGWTRCSTSSSRAPVSTRFKGGGSLDRMTCASMSVGRNTARWRPSSGSCRRWGLSCSMNLV